MDKKTCRKLRREFDQADYGLKSVKDFSKEVQEYILDRHERGIEELKSKGEYPTKTGDNGYTALLGVWRYTESKGIDCAIGKKEVWMAQLINSELI